MSLDHAAMFWCRGSRCVSKLAALLLPSPYNAAVPKGPAFSFLNYSAYAPTSAPAGSYSLSIGTVPKCGTHTAAE